MHFPLRARRYFFQECEIILWEGQLFAKLFVNGQKELDYWNPLRHFSASKYFEKTLRLHEDHKLQIKPRVLSFWYPDGLSELLIDGEEPNFEWISLSELLSSINSE